MVPLVPPPIQAPLPVRCSVLGSCEGGNGAVAGSGDEAAAGGIGDGAGGLSEHVTVGTHAHSDALSIVVRRHLDVAVSVGEGAPFTTATPVQLTEALVPVGYKAAPSLALRS
jgi:hypothetical protein